MKICIYGYGVVGNSMHRLFDGNEILISDPALGFEIEPLELTQLRESDIVVICINAPASDKGYDTTGVGAILAELDNAKCKALVAIKTTILPHQFEVYAKVFDNLNLCAWPEFLNNNTADDDVLNPNQLFGGNYSQLKILENALPNANIQRVSPSEAFQIKILWNLFGALKVTFWHSIQNSGFADIPSLKPKWDSWSKNLVQGDLNVICKDGKYGFGGKCYPKELNAFLLQFDSELLETAKEVNDWIRKSK